jgi:DNA-directed RNA polymerase specialized sigma54-like protein
MAKTLKFYTEHEMSILNNFAASKAPVNNNLIGQFCKDYTRSEHSVTCKVYELRKKLGIENSRPPRPIKNKTITPKATVVKDNSVARVSKGEFKIPVNNWNITNEEGQMFLNIKF